jgi:hypothetical protein
MVNPFVCRTIKKETVLKHFSCPSERSVFELRRILPSELDSLLGLRFSFFIEQKLEMIDRWIDLRIRVSPLALRLVARLCYDPRHVSIPL